MLVYKYPCTPLKMSLPENKTTVNLKSASLVVIMLSHKGEFHFKYLSISFIKWAKCPIVS